MSVSALAKQLFASEATVRRELRRLEERGAVIRTHGRAVAVSAYADRNEGFLPRALTASPHKRKIAEAAVAALVREGDVVMLDASSTVCHAVEALAACKDIIVITSGLRTQALLAEAGIRFYATGGRAINDSLSFVGQTAIDTVKSFHADIALVSCHGVSDTGFATDTSEQENDLRRAMLERAARRVLLVDSTKIGRGCWHSLCDLSLFDDVFCDAPLPPQLAERVRCFHLVE